MSADNMITIVDYGMGNLASIKNMLKKIGVSAEITSSPEVLKDAKRIVLPGVGAFDNAMINIRQRGLLDVLSQKAIIEKIPFLGICLGMQILMNSSEEGKEPGLGWVEGKVKRFRFDANSDRLKVPHMGWNVVQPKDESAVLFGSMKEPRFYFVHSYYVTCDNQNHILSTTTHGVEFTSSVRKGHIYGTQFHPEKSHKFGMQLFKNFMENS
ncbi:MAG: imidazole glycerol phosphate synthase subunit HisH [Fulvivirga sp.]